MLTDEELRGALEDMSGGRAFVADPQRALGRAGQLRRRRLAGLTAASVVTVAVVAAVVVGVHSAGTGSRLPTATGSTISPTSDYVVWGSNDHSEIVSVTTDRVVATLPLILSSPAISADGSKVFGYYSGRLGGDGSGNNNSSDPAVRRLIDADKFWHVVSVDISTGAVTQLAKRRPPINGLSMSADGSMLAYAVAPGAASNNSPVYVMNLSTGTTKRYVDRSRGKKAEGPQQLIHPALSPDGSKLAFVQAYSNSPTHSPLEIATLTGNNSIRKARSSNPSSDCHYDYPTWGPGGLYVDQQCGQAQHNLLENISPKGGEDDSVRLPKGYVADISSVPTTPRPTFVLTSSKGLIKVRAGSNRIDHLNYPVPPSGG